MAIEKDAGSDADFAAVLAELEADQGSDGDVETEEATPGADVDSDPAADDESEDESEEIENEESEDDELEDESPAASADVETFKDELAELLDGGDLKGLAEKLGKDPAIFKLNNKQFKAARVAERNARKAKAEADTALATAAEKETNATKLQSGAEETYGPIVAGFNEYHKGNHMAARAAIELMFEDKFENIVANMARAAKGLDPGQVEVLKLRKELAERDRKVAEQQTAAQAQAEEATQVSAIAGKLKTTPLAGIADEAAGQIWALIKASKHPTLNKYTKTLKEAYQEVKDKELARVAKLGGKIEKKGKTPAPADKRLPLDKTPLAGKRPVPKKLTEEQEFERELELVKRQTQAQERKLRRSK
jgi:hypothetical protein